MSKLALITGASSGIGKELAKIHAQKKGDLIIVARSEDKLQELKEQLEQQHGITVTVIVKDLSREEGPKEVYDEVKAKGLEVDYLINNAGFGGVGKFHERDWETDRSMIQLNVVALTALTRYFLPDFVARNSGKVLNVSSTASLMAGPMQAVYFATKAFVTSFSNAVAEELHDTDVTVTALLPGATATGFGDVSGMNDTELFKDPHPASEVAKDGYDAMISGKLEVLSGMSLAQKAMMAMIPITPKKVLLPQIRKMQEPK